MRCEMGMSDGEEVAGEIRWCRCSMRREMVMVMVMMMVMVMVMVR
jgi:hypothetical protein